MVKIARQQFIADFDKNKNLVLQSTKLFVNGKKHIDKCILTKKQISELLRIKERALFMHKVRELNVVTDLHLTSKDKKAGICANTGYCTSADGIARALNHIKVKYINVSATKKTATKKSKKTATKKTATKKSNKK